MRPIAPLIALISMAAWSFSPLAQAAETRLPTNTSLLAKADAGDARAQYETGRRLALGQGVDMDKARAQQYFAQSAAQGFAPSEYEMARYYSGVSGAVFDKPKALEYTRRAADHGHLPAQVDLAFAYFNGSDLLTRDSRESAVWFRKAADGGSVIAQCMLGDFYRNGWGGLPKDPARAFGYYRKTATQADRCAAKSQYALYVGYESGSGTNRDLAAATRWLKKSAEAKNPQAQATLGRNFLKGYGVPKNEDTGMDWIRKSREGVAPHDEVHDEHGH